MGVGESLHRLGEVARARRDDAAAERYFRQALAVHEATLGPADIHVARDLKGLLFIAGKGDGRARASWIQSRALRRAEAAMGPDHPDMVPFLLGMTAPYSALAAVDQP